MAQTLDADVDELSALAGKIRADLVDVLALNPIAINVFGSVAASIERNEDWQQYLQGDNAKDPRTESD